MYIHILYLCSATQFCASLAQRTKLPAAHVLKGLHDNVHEPEAMLCFQMSARLRPLDRSQYTTIMMRNYSSGGQRRP